jgi:hypothetical protein
MGAGAAAIGAGDGERLEDESLELDEPPELDDALEGAPELGESLDGAPLELEESLPPLAVSAELWARCLRFDDTLAGVIVTLDDRPDVALVTISFAEAWPVNAWAATSVRRPAHSTEPTVSERFTRDIRRRAASLVFCARELMGGSVAEGVDRCNAGN